MSRFPKICAAVLVTVAVPTMGVAQAQAQPYGSCEPERVINSLADAVLRVAPLFIKPKAAPALQPVAQVETPQTLQPADMTREQWKQSLLDGARKYCVQYPDDTICQR